MNAKKIMGAVLVALLAAALFVGAGAAEEEGLGTVFLYQEGNLPAGLAAGSYSCGDSTVTVTNANIVTTSDLAKFVDGGKYTNGTHYFIVKLPNAIFTATAGNVDALANGLVADTPVDVSAEAEITGFTVASIIVFNPDGEPTYIGADHIDDSTMFTQKGEYKLQAILSPTGFAETIDTALLYGKKYVLNVYSTEPEITASADTVIVNNFITVTITGAPGQTYNLVAEGFTIPTGNQIVPATTSATQTSGSEEPIYNVNVNAGTADIQLPNTGKLTVYLKATNDDDKQTIKLMKNGEKKASATVTIVEGTITAVADADSFYIGKDILISGTTTAGSDLKFWIQGTNFAFTNISKSEYPNAELEVENGEWTYKISSAEIQTADGNAKKLVAGTYTIIVTTSDATTKEAIMKEVYATVAITLTQPFLTDIEADATAIQGSDYEITGTAIAAENVKLYVFGTSFFAAQTKATEDEDAFKFTIKGEDLEDMAPGVYFYLIQHPMNDGKFNVWNGTVNANSVDAELYATFSRGVEADFFYAATGETGDATFIFNAWKRGTNYAAQALLDEISGQNIDDIFVQGTFEVAAQKLTINPIPAEVTKGSKLAVSGTTNNGDGVEVVINVLAGTFGATIKGDENAATFLTEKAITNDDGTWEAAIDTSKLPVGDYIVTVELDNEMFDSANVKIVDAAPVTPPTDKPDTPVTPPADDKPTEPETPGFGALAALAGLGAVAVLLLRRE